MSLPPGAGHGGTLEGGGELPFGVESVRALGGRRLQVVDGEEQVVLEGTVPVIGAHEEPPPPPPPEEGDPVVTRSMMHRTGEAGDRDCGGTLVASTRADGSALRIEVGRIDPEHGYVVYLWAEEGLVLWGDFRTNGDGSASLVADTGSDAGLPLHAGSVAALAGRRVEVRDRDGRLYLYGEIPSAESYEDEKPVREVDRHKDKETGADVKIIVDIKPQRGHEEMHVVVKHLPRQAHSPGKRARPVVSIRFEDAFGGFRRAGNAVVQRCQAAKRWTTRGGRELPLGVESLRDLAGRRFEMWVGRTRVASGSLPQY